MAISGIEQPDYLEIEDGLRLRKFEDILPEALEWYQDIETVYLVDGVRVPYTPEKLERMYRYLEKQGELYYIEILENGAFRPIGDVTFWQKDMPIVIGVRAYQRKGIGVKVIRALIRRGRALGYDRLSVNEIYDYNIGSRCCFEKAGFRVCEKTEQGSRLTINLREQHEGCASI